MDLQGVLQVASSHTSGLLDQGAHGSAKQRDADKEEQTATQHD
jgi:hypothetical protein